MSLPVVLLVGLLGGVGAVARVTLTRAVDARTAHPSFPWGTVVVNASGAFLLGVVVGASLTHGEERALGAGLLGAYTTFSTWMYDSHRLAGEGRPRLAAMDLALLPGPGFGPARAA